MELDYDTERYDIRIKSTSTDFDMDWETSKQAKQVIVSPPECTFSLCAYCSILYLKPRMQIIIRGQKVKTQIVSKNLAHIRIDNYRPKFLNTRVAITFGYNVLSKDYGIMMYHKNRLIKAYHHVGPHLKGVGVGIIGVIECNFLKPTHNKQDFEETDEYRKTIGNVAMKLEEYRKEMQHKRQQKDPNCSISLEDTMTCPDKTWVQCDNCLKFRKLPDGIDKDKLPDEWFCKMNPDPLYRSCEAPEQEDDDEDTYIKSYKEHERQKKLEAEKKRIEMEEAKRKEEMEIRERLAKLEREKKERKQRRQERYLNRIARAATPDGPSQTDLSPASEPSIPSRKKRKRSAGLDGSEAKQARYGYSPWSEIHMALSPATTGDTCHNPNPRPLMEAISNDNKDDSDDDVIIDEAMSTPKPTPPTFDLSRVKTEKSSNVECSDGDDPEEPRTKTSPTSPEQVGVSMAIQTETNGTIKNEEEENTVHLGADDPEEPRTKTSPTSPEQVGVRMAIQTVTNGTIKNEEEENTVHLGADDPEEPRTCPATPTPILLSSKQVEVSMAIQTETNGTIKIEEEKNSENLQEESEAKDVEMEGTELGMSLHIKEEIQIGIDDATAPVSSHTEAPSAEGNQVMESRGDMGGEIEATEARQTKPSTSGNRVRVAVVPPRQPTPVENTFLTEAQQQQDQLMDLMEKTALERDSYRKEVQQHNAKVKDLEQAVRELNQRLVNKEQKMEQLEKERDALVEERRELEEKSREVQQLNAKVKDLEQTVRELNQKLVNKEQKMEQLHLVKKEQNHQACQTDHLEGEGDNKVLREQMEQLQKERDALVEEKREWEEKSKGEGNSSRSPQKEKKDEEAQINIVDDELALQVDLLLRQLDQGNMEQDQLKTQLASVEVERAALASQMEQMKEELEELKEASMNFGHGEAGVHTAGGSSPRYEVIEVKIETQGEGEPQANDQTHCSPDLHGKNKRYREDHHIAAPKRSCESCTEVPDSSHWVLVKPEVSVENSISNYSLSSPAGSFECSVSGLRWSCAWPVTLQYCFKDWHLLADELPQIQYRPAGPSMDIKFISGELEEIHLPHFLCLGGNQSHLKDTVKVLHMEDSGGVFLETFELSRFHARLVNPSFSLFGVFYSLKSLMFPGKEKEREKQIEIHADVQVYLSSTSPLTFHIYLLPLDAHLRQLLEDQEEGFKGKRLAKPRPGRALQLNKYYALKAHCETAGGLDPEELELRQSSNTAPNFSEVRISEAADFKMELLSPADQQKVWEACICSSECSCALGHSHSEGEKMSSTLQIR